MVPPTLVSGNGSATNRHRRSATQPTAAALLRQRDAHPLTRRRPRETRGRLIHAASERERHACFCAGLDVMPVHTDRG